MSNLGESEFDFECPNCNKKNKVTLKQVERQETIVCIGCKSRIKLEDKDGSMRKALKEIDDSINNLFKK